MDRDEISYNVIETVKKWLAIPEEDDTISEETFLVQDLETDPKTMIDILTDIFCFFDINLREDSDPPQELKIGHLVEMLDTYLNTVYTEEEKPKWIH